MTEPLFIEIDHAQCRKAGENICGDAFCSLKLADEKRYISVLSDGLGSGVKANILASMTAHMAMKFTAGGVDFAHAAEIMMEALPVCRVRKISYATFSIVDCRLGAPTRIIEMDNPGCMIVRNGRKLSVPCKTLASPRWRDRRMHFLQMDMQPEDRIVLLSDGISQAGLGAPAYPLGWREEGCRDFVLDVISREPDVSARQLAKRCLREALNKEPGYRPHDDMTCAVIYFRRPRGLLLLSGPPFHAGRDAEYARMLQNFSGTKVICGGSTANIVARELGRNVEMDLEDLSDDLPPISRMDGVHLVTEGILTLTRVAAMLEDGRRTEGRNGAVRLFELLLESDSIRFVVGSRINEAHQDPRLPLDIEFRRNIVKRIARALETKHFKEVSITYI